MGCLFELIFEVVFEIILEAVLAIYTKLMTLLVPNHSFDKKLRERMKKGVTIFALLLLLCALIGFFLFVQPPSVVKTVGAFMLFVPLGMMCVQILAGMIYRIVKAIKSRP